MKKASNVAGFETAASDPARRAVTRALLAGVVAVPFARVLRAQPGRDAVEVWTGPGCACCHEWVEHLEQHGFDVRLHDGGNRQARERLGMPDRYASCHSAEVGGYALEGHVPAREIDRLLDERPEALGLSVPAMPRGSPGMDSPAYGGVTDPYDVLLIGRDGSASVFESYP